MAAERGAGQQQSQEMMEGERPLWAGLSESKLLSARKRLLGTRWTSTTVPRRSQKKLVSPAPSHPCHAK